MDEKEKLSTIQELNTLIDMHAAKASIVNAAYNEHEYLVQCKVLALIHPSDT